MQEYSTRRDRSLLKAPSTPRTHLLPHSAKPQTQLAMAGFHRETSVAADDFHHQIRSTIQIVPGLNQNVGIYQQ